MPPVDRPGRFRAKSIATSLFQSSKSKSVAVNITFRLLEMLDQDEDGKSFWRPWAYDHDAEHAAWIIKKDGTTNEDALANLAEIFGWKGDITEFALDKIPETFVQVAVETHEYNGKTTYRVAWVNRYDDDAGAKDQKVSAADAAAIQNQFGSEFRAIAGNVQRNAPPQAPNHQPQPATAPASPVDSGGATPF